MKFLFLPFSWIYGALTWLRNKLYDKGVLPVYHSPLSSIVIGNLQVGGSGKTPMTAYLYKLFSPVYATAILSRGYGRKTSGLIEADAEADAQTIGDEPLWYYQTLPGVRVVVSESRKKGMQYLEQTPVKLVLLDDAYQHRSFEGNVKIVLSDFQNPYFSDFPLPFGRMREYRSGDKRADIIIMTKCPAGMSLQEKIAAIQRINPLDHQAVFFTALNAGTPYALKGNLPFPALQIKRAIALSGIAGPESFRLICVQFTSDLETLSFRDHHNYSIADMQSLLARMGDDAIVFTTEKDAVKLKAESLIGILPENRVFVVPVQPVFLFQETERFNTLIRSLIRNKTKAGLNTLN